MRLFMLDAQAVTLSPLRANVESDGNQTCLVLGNRRKPCRLFIHRENPPDIQELGNAHVEVSNAHVYFHNRNFLLLAENKPEADRSSLIFFETLLPHRFKGKPLEAWDWEDNALTQRIYCDHVVPNRDLDCLQFQGFTFLRSGDVVEICHKPVGLSLGFIRIECGKELLVGFKREVQFAS